MSSFTRVEIIVALSVACALCAGVQAQVSWERHGDVPVLPGGDPGSWDSGVAAGMCVLREPGGYKGWYTGAQSPSSPAQIGLAISQDGVEWERAGSTPVLLGLPGTWEETVYHPSVIHDASGYQMWYGGSSAGICQIGHATSADGTDWVRDGTPVLSIENIPWESACIDTPRVAVVEGRYFMYYTGGPLSITDFRSWAIGLATSADGIGWTRYAGNPVFKLDTPEDPTGVVASFVRHDAALGAFEMWHNILHAPQDNGVAIGYATSADGIEWCSYPENPVLSPADGTWDYGFTGNPSVLFGDGEYRLWYTGGVQGSTYATGYAVSEWSVPRASFSAVPRAAPESPTVDFDASLSATPNRSFSSYVWDFGDGSPAVTVDGDPRTSHTYATPGHYVARLTAVDSAGAEGCVARGVDVPAPSCDVAPWSVAQIGPPLFAGGACLAESTACLNIVAGGRLLSGASDQLTFVHQQARGDIVLTARIGAADGGGGWQAGVMLRESLEAGSRHASMLVDESNPLAPIRFRSVARSSTGGATTPARNGEEASPPGAWVRVERRGDDFISSSSSDGMSWTVLRTVTLPGAAETVFAGLVAIANDTRASSPFLALEAELCDIALVPAAPPGVGPFLRGDCNGDGTVTGQVTDAVFLLDFNFTGGAAPPCAAACDANGDGSFSGQVTDAVYLLNFNFLGGPALPAPFPACDRSELAGDAALGCATPAPCP